MNMNQQVLLLFQQDESDASAVSKGFSSFSLGYDEELKTAQISVSTFQKRRSLDRQVLEFLGIPDENTFGIALGTTVNPLRPRKTPQPDATEKLAGSLAHVFPELNKVSDEVIDRAIRRSRKKR